MHTDPKKLLLAVCLCVTASSLLAQGPEKKWEIEFHATGFLKDDANSGRSSLPPPGPSFSTAAGPSRQISSFLFGDGNALINQVLAGQGLNPIRSLDGAILNNRLALERQSNVGVGFRVSR